MTPRIRHISIPVRTAGAVEAHVKWIAEHWDTYRETCWASAPDVLRAGGSSDRRTPGHSDPTSVIATFDTGYDDTEEGLTAALAQVRWVIDRMQTMLVNHGPQAREADQNRVRLRCDGSIDPLCTNYAAPGRRGLCDACYMRNYRSRVTTRDQHQREPVTEPATVRAIGSPVSVEPQLPTAGLRTATAECIHCGQAFTAAGYDEQQARTDAVNLRDRHQCSAQVVSA